MADMFMRPSLRKIRKMEYREVKEAEQKRRIALGLWDWQRCRRSITIDVSINYFII